MLAFALLMLTPALLAAQTQGQYMGNAAGSQQSYPVSGTVVNSVTGEPISRALVQVGQYAAFSDGQGRFDFAAVPYRGIQIMVRKPGYASELEMNQRPEMLQPDQQNSALVLKLTPEGALTGRVVDENDEPVERVSVQVVQRRIQNGRYITMPRNGGVTDEDGEFRVGDLAPGSYFVGVHGAGNRPTMAGAVRFGFAPAFYPGVATQREASPVEVLPGGERRITLKLRAQPLFQISGHARGAPDTFGSVRLETEDGMSLMGGAVNNVTGEFRLQDVPAGSYILRGEWRDVNQPPGVAQGQADLFYAEQPIQVRRNISDVVLAPEKAASIPIEVAADSDAGGGAATPPQFFGQIHLVSLDQPSRQVYSTMLQGADGKLQFVVQNIEAGRYRAEFNPSGSQWYVASATCGNTDVIKDMLAVTTGRPMPPIQIVLRNDASSMSATISGDPAPSQAVLVLAPDAPGVPPLTRPSPVRQSEQQPLRMDLNGVPPGGYTVYAFDSVADLEYSNPDALREYTSAAQHITLAPKQKANVTLQLIQRSK